MLNLILVNLGVKFEKVKNSMLSSFFQFVGIFMISLINVRTWAFGFSKFGSSSLLSLFLFIFTYFFTAYFALSFGLFCLFIPCTKPTVPISQAHWKLNCGPHSSYFSLFISSSSWIFDSTLTLPLQAPLRAPQGLLLGHFGLLVFSFGQVLIGYCGLFFMLIWFLLLLYSITEPIVA